MTAYIAQLEQGQVTPGDTAQHSDTNANLKDVPEYQSGRVVSNPQVVKAKEDRAKLQGFIVTAGNLDDQRADGPRPVTPMRPVNAAQLPLVSDDVHQEAVPTG
jgi:hypothetical protein